jgi:arsenical pump membrane protein
MMIEQILVIIIFLLNIGLLLYFVVKKPYFRVNLFSKEIIVESYAIIVVIGPVILLLFGLIDFSQILGGLFSDSGAQPFGILILFLSMVFLSLYLDNVGFLEYCAKIALKHSGNSGKKLFVSLYILVAFLTILTSNDIIILTITPFIYYFAKHSGIDPKPFLFMEFFVANTWSIMLQIGNPTNIYITDSFGILFFDYIFKMFFPSLFGGIVNFLVLYFLFKKSFDVSIKVDPNMNPIDSITDKVGAIIGISILSLCIMCLSIAPYLGISMWIISLFFMLLLILILSIRALFRNVVCKKKIDFSIIMKTFSRMPFSVIPFVLSFFVLVIAFTTYGISEMIASSLGSVSVGLLGFIFVYGFISAISCNFLNNIPMSVLFSQVLTFVPVGFLLPSAYSVIVGSNLGANITPIGALAGIMWFNILKNKGYEIKFYEFFVYGAIVTLLTLVTVLSVLFIEFRLFG